MTEPKEQAGGNKTILLVEDEEAHAELIRKLFEDIGSDWKIEWVASFKEAMKWLAENENKPPSLIIADYLLPDGDGLSVIGKGRKMGEVGIPGIILTSYGSERLAVRSLKSGAMDYVTKNAVELQDLPWTAERVLREWLNIAERKRAEEEREQLLKELKKERDKLKKAMGHMADLKEVTRMKTDFLSITSHELKTPLTPMKSQLQMLREGYVGKLNKKQEKSIEVVLRNLTRLENLIGDILDLSRIEAGRIKLSFDSMNLNDAVKEAIKMQEAFAKGKNIEIRAKLAEMPNIIGDAERLRQAIGNLLNNAIKFSEKTGKVIIETKRLGKNVQVSITDYGIGIAKADQKKLFKPFSQIDSSMRREHVGTGLGLAIAKGLIQAHNGNVGAESALGKGSTFYFSIPITQKITKKEAPYIG